VLRQHVVGDQLSLADITLATLLGHLQLASSTFSLEPYPKLNAFFQHIKAGEAFRTSHADLEALLAMRK
jgi:glutathione S-transferase